MLLNIIGFYLHKYKDLKVEEYSQNY